MRLDWRFVWVSGLSFAGLGGCGGDPDLVRDGDPDPGPAVGGRSPGSGGQIGNTGGTMIGVGGRSTVTGGRANGGGVAIDPCDDIECGPGQRCEVENTEGVCIDNECDDLDCSALEECVSATGGGNRCVSIACDDDVDCSVARYCDGEKCVRRRV